MGAEVLVETWMISLPWTTRLSFDFFSSRVKVSIKADPQTADQQCNRTKSSLKHTVTTQIKINDVGSADVDDPKKALVLALELLLVKDLNCDDR